MGSGAFFMPGYDKLPVLRYSQNYVANGKF